MPRETYKDKVALLVRALPYVAEEPIFALKGGTAINLFYRDLPRLSVDIDLTYLPVKERNESLDEINSALDRLAASLEKGISGARAQRIKGGGGGATRLLVRLNGVEIKIETSPVTRGVVHAPEVRAVTEIVEDSFGFAEMQIVSFEDLFAGKLSAAMDRQHPRDLFDVMLLYENEGLTVDLFRTFLIYVACSPRPAHELLNPNRIDLDRPFLSEFDGMTQKPIALRELVNTREHLFADIQSRIDDGVRRFLLGLHNGEPDFAAIHRPSAAALPAVRWKQLNLEKLRRENPKKHAAQRQLLLGL